MSDTWKSEVSQPPVAPENDVHCVMRATSSVTSASVKSLNAADRASGLGAGIRWIGAHLCFWRSLVRRRRLIDATRVTSQDSSMLLLGGVGAYRWVESFVGYPSMF